MLGLSRRRRSRSARGRPATLAAAHLPAPVGGLNTVAAGSAMPEGDCVQLWNMVAAEYGLRSRLGYRDWCTGLTGAESDEVRAVLPFLGAAANGAGDRLFATTSSGIWDVSASTGTPTQVLAFASPGGEAGYGVCCGMMTAAGHFLLYCDEANGYHVYSEASATWTAPTMGSGAGQVDNVNPAHLAFVGVWKSRVFFAERSSSRAWYLPAGAIYGAAASLELGAQFRAGGPLVGLWNWTVDGGAGLDDLLVAVSGGGDVAIYQGTNPASAETFGLRGVWSAGGLPVGRGVASSLGGDLLLLTKAGLRPLSQLVVGGEGQGQYLTAKVGNLFNALMLTRSTMRGWSLHLHPEDNVLLVTVPTVAGHATEQFAQALWNRSWSRYRDLPIYSAGVWRGQLYFGTPDGRLAINTGYVDGVSISDPSAYTPVQWALMTGFRNLGNGRYKRVQSIRPTLLSESVLPAFVAGARYGYDFRELPAVSQAPGGGGAWDTATWGTAVWGGEYQAAQQVRGAAGCGVDVAIALRGQATSRTVLVGMDVLFDQGGPL